MKFPAWVGAAVVLALSGCGSAAAPASPSTPASAAKPAPSVSAAAPSAKPAASAASAKPAASGKPAPSGGVAASGAASAKPGGSGGIPLVLTYAQTSATFMQAYYAADAGIFAKNGLDAKVQLAESSTGMAALLSGQTQVGMIGGTEVLDANAGGADIVVTANPVPVYPFVFYVQKDVKTGADLKGKKVGITRFGSTIDVATRIALEKLGITANDVTILQLGTVQARTTALINGSIQAGLSNPPETLKLDAAGLHQILSLAKAKAPATTALIASPRPWIAAHHDVMQKVVDSIVQATAQMKTDKAGAIATLKKYLKDDNQADLESTYQFYVDEVFPAYPTPEAAQFKDIVDTAKNSKVKALDLSKYIDDSFVKSAQQRGLDKPRG